MNLADLLDEIWEVLEGIPGLNVSDDGPGSAAGGTPAPHLELPALVYGQYGSGLDAIPDLGLVVVFGPANNELVYRQALEAASTSGARSIPLALKNATFTACHTLRVAGADPLTIEQRGGNLALAYEFHLHITGAP
jgi:hypothetical protein